MIRKYWLPLVCTLFLFHLFFIDNIAIHSEDNSTYDVEKQVIKHSLGGVNDFGDDSQELTHYGSLVDIEDFEDFLSSFKSKPFSIESVQYLDTTGDGLKEKVLYTVSIINNECIVDQSIIKKGKMIWKESFTLNEDHADKSFSSNSIDTYGPYALYYLGNCLAPFIEDIKLDGLYSNRIKRIARNQLDQTQVDLDEMYNSNLANLLENYNGLFVFKRNPGHEGIYMWDVNSESFIEVYKPQLLSA